MQTIPAICKRFRRMVSPSSQNRLHMAAGYNNLLIDGASDVAA